VPSEPRAARMTTAGSVVRKDIRGLLGRGTVAERSVGDGAHQHK
jgi:hypothetical protein